MLCFLGPDITFDVHLPGFVVHVDINVNQLFDIRNSSLLLLYAKLAVYM